MNEITDFGSNKLSILLDKLYIICYDNYDYIIANDIEVSGRSLSVLSFKVMLTITNGNWLSNYTQNVSLISIIRTN